MATMWQTIAGNSPDSRKVSATALPSLTASRAFSMTEASTWLFKMDSTMLMAVKIGTPLAKSVESVRAKRATFSMRIRGPKIGTRKVKASQEGLPPSLTRHRLKSVTAPPKAKKMRSHQSATEFTEGDEDAGHRGELSAHLLKHLRHLRDDEEHHERDDDPT